MHSLKRYGSAAVLAAALAGPAWAQISDDVVKIGVIADMSGPYSAITGIGLVRAVELAVKDFGGTVLGKRIEVISANHQGKVDVASAKAREWLDVDKVDLIIEATDSASAIAMQKIAVGKKKPIIFAGSGSSALTGKECSAYGIQWSYNTYAMAAGTARAIAEGGGDTWYMIALDAAFGQTMERDVANVLKATGGRIVGASRHPMNAPDFASLLLQAQNSKAKVVGFGNAGTDLQNALRQAAEFGLPKNQTLAALLIFDTDIKGLGLQLAQGLQYTTGFYWDRTPETREFSKRFMAVQKATPSMSQAGAYSGALHFLKAAAAAGTDAAEPVLEKMRATPVNDVFVKNGHIRADGQHVHDMYLAEVKKPGESTSEWDLARIKRTIPADVAFQPLADSECPLVKR
ncbi:MAG: ABC transporter substrate-binding protein [Rubrivivax sp.]